ncbi:MAG: UvrD-helicase domain-containing protein [Eubacteriales bacterium]|nr:UvrD-helicase domain-containing protein [Eubacteriales bacterium]
MRKAGDELKQIADLHIHSRFSRATSKEGTPEHLDLWARKKGISIVGTGDFTHPAWREELNEKLVPGEEGLYVLKDDCLLDGVSSLPGEAPRFVISGEISSIYKKNGKTRKVHNVILLPSLEDAHKLSVKLEAIGNIHSDGRPILGLDSRDLLEIMLETCPQGILIPAHIWTPHFSLFGAFSGFDTIEECFEDLTPYVHALETGLSSDPPMNWRLSALDRFQLISNSDAHSPAKLGREANLLDTDRSYQGLSAAIQEGKGLEGTIEFFPEEGKYHYDGHRKCHICLSPAEAERYGGKCPVCGKKLTIGVDHRVVQLADREEGYVKEDGKLYQSLVPLPEVIAVSTGHSSASRKVQEQYEEMLGNLGAEFSILRDVPIEDIKKESGYLVAEGIRRLRDGQVIRRPGFDGEYGTVKLFEPWEIQNVDGQISLFQGINEWMAEGGSCESQEPDSCSQGQIPFSPGAGTERTDEGNTDSGNAELESVQAASQTLNEQQQEAVEAVDRAVAVIAGPGTGKTKTLVSRILYLLEHRKVKPSEITAVTFTNQAAAEMKERLALQLGGGRNVQRMNIGTFHGISLDFLKKAGVEFTLAGQEEVWELAGEICKEYGISLPPRKFLQEVSLWKIGGKYREREEGNQPHYEAFEAYESRLREDGRFDFDDLLLETLRIFREKGTEYSRKNPACQQAFSYLLVDEFQDISPLQYELIKAWNDHGRELFVIGDPDQSIYGFRGSDAYCFQHLKADYPDTKVITLEKNYRSAGAVVSAAVEVISHNPGGVRTLEPDCSDGMPVRVVKASGKMQEAIFAAKEVNRLIGGIDMLDTEEQEAFREDKKPWTFRDIAILYRTHHQARLLEKCLSQEGIPYTVGGREEFLSKPLVRGTVAFFRSLSEPENMAYRTQAMKLLWDLEDDSLSLSIYRQMESKYKTKWKRSRPRKLVESWMSDLEQEENEELLYLAEMAVCYSNMNELLDALLLGEEGDLKRCGGKSYTADAVHLMTLHGSKGLEFPVVILYGAGEGEIPLENEKYPADTEEERRLFYVGMTRAKDELIITYAQEASPFLAELPDKSVRKETAGRKKAAEAARQMSLFDFI